ncbi:MAG: hypothetical protein ACW981_09935 [Candidatus Hodarchaeales archaeon]|jgi:uncharacterized glyoxalase superfamily protein PhnB
MIIGKNISLFAVFSDSKELENIYGKLLEEGKIIMPLADSPSGGKFVMIKDKIEIQWILACQ